MFVAWPMEKSSLLPSRTLAQLACQDFKKESPDSNAAVLSPQSSYALHMLQQLNFGRIIGDQEAFLWTSHDSGNLPASPKSLTQVDCHSFKIEHLGGLAAPMLCSNALIPLKTFPVTKFLAASISIPLKLPALKATVGELQKLNSYTIYAIEFEAASNGESLDNPDSANMCLPSNTNGEPQDAFDFSGQQNLPSNETLTCFTPSLSHRDFPVLMISLLVIC